MPLSKKQVKLKLMNAALAAKRAREREGRQIQEAANHSGSDSESDLSDDPAAATLRPAARVCLIARCTATGKQVRDLTTDQRDCGWHAVWTAVQLAGDGPVCWCDPHRKQITDPGGGSLGVDKTFQRADFLAEIRRSNVVLHPVTGAHSMRGTAAGTDRTSMRRCLVDVIDPPPAVYVSVTRPSGLGASSEAYSTPGVPAHGAAVAGHTYGVIGRQLVWMASEMRCGVTGCPGSRDPQYVSQIVAGYAVVFCACTSGLREHRSRIDTSGSGPNPDGSDTRSDMETRMCVLAYATGTMFPHLVRTFIGGGWDATVSPLFSIWSRVSQVMHPLVQTLTNEHVQTNREETTARSPDGIVHCVGSDCGWNQARNSSIGYNVTVAWSPPHPSTVDTTPQDRAGFVRGVVIAFSIMDKTTTDWETRHLGIPKFVGKSETMEAFGVERDFNSLMEWSYKAAQAMIDGDSTNAKILVKIFNKMYEKYGVKTILGHCLGHHLVNVMKEIVKIAMGTSAKYSGKAAHKGNIYGTCEGVQKKPKRKNLAKGKGARSYNAKWVLVPVGRSKSRIKCSRLDKQGIIAKKVKKMIWALAKRWFPPTLSTEAELQVLVGTFGNELFRRLEANHFAVAGSSGIDPATTAGRRVSCGAQIYELKRYLKSAVVDEIRNYVLLNEGPGGTMKVETKMSSVARGLPKRLALNTASESAIRIMLALVASDQNTRHEWDEEADAAAATQARACDSPPPLQQHRSWQQKFLERCEQELGVPLLSETARHRFWAMARQNYWSSKSRMKHRHEINMKANAADIADADDKIAKEKRNMPKFKQAISRQLQARAAAEAAEAGMNAGGFEVPDPDTDDSESDSCHESGESDGGCDSGEDNDYKGGATKALYAEGVTAAVSGATMSRRKRKTAEPEAGAGPGKNPTHDDDITISVHPGHATLHRVSMPATVPRRGSRKTTSLYAISREVFGVGD